MTETKKMTVVPDARGVVAEILADGRIRPMTSPTAEAERKVWASGVVPGDGWVLWWERRRLASG